MVLRNDEYVRLQTIFLAIANHSDQPPERARWLALVQACQEELVTAGETRAHLARLAIAASHRSVKDTSRQPIDRLIGARTVAVHEHEQPATHATGRPRRS